MIKIRAAENQIEIYSDNKIIEIIQGPLTRIEAGRIVADWFYGKTMQVEVMDYCTWYYEDIGVKYAPGGIIKI